MTKKIAIFGAGGFAREVLQIVLDLNDSSIDRTKWLPVGFIVDPAYLNATPTVHNLPILKGIDWLKENTDVEVIIAIGAPAHRRRIANFIKTQTANKFATLIHPRAWVGRNVQIGAGSIICAGSLITTDISIGEHVHVNIGCTIGHDATLRDFVTLSPSVNVSGNVEIGQGVEAGTRSVLIPRANIGEWSILGAGTVVTKPLPSNVTAVGLPAKVIKTLNADWHCQ